MRLQAGISNKPQILYLSQMGDNILLNNTFKMNPLLSTYDLVSTYDVVSLARVQFSLRRMKGVNVSVCIIIQIER